MTDMYGMFYDTPNFNQDISMFETSSVKTMAYMW